MRETWRTTMTTAKYVYWQDGPWWVGYLEEFPTYSTQGESLDDLIDHLQDLYHEFTTGGFPNVRRVSRQVGELVIA
jgi:hypothetical protein